MRDVVLFAGAVALGCGIGIVSDRDPTLLGPLDPYGFSPAIYVVLVGSALLYARGARRGPPPSRTASVLFGTGLLLFWTVLQTRFNYLAQHMFALTRVTHLVTHHLAPFCLALAWPWPVIARGIPGALDRSLRTDVGARVAGVARAAMEVVQGPIVAASLFVGLIALWLVPPVQFRAMLDPDLFAAMNWSMALDGVLFWSMILGPGDRRPSLPVRLLVTFGVQIPQVMIGAYVANTGVDLYPSYSLCGRLFPAVGPMLDQEVGGFVVWYVAGMMSAATVLILLARMRAAERTATRTETVGLVQAGSRP